MPLSESLVDVAWKELASDICVCGGRKVPKQSFFRACYFSLPKELRLDLYKPMSEGYAEIYDQAKTYLRAETDRMKQGRPL